jgi:hypothetical protein
MGSRHETLVLRRYYGVNTAIRSETRFAYTLTNILEKDSKESKMVPILSHEIYRYLPKYYNNLR